jgi:enoyl-CoA hydratase
MSQYENLKTSIRDGAFIITINRPEKLNALNRATVQEIGKAVKSASEDIAIYGVIITGEGNKAFAAGADIKEFAGLTPEQGREMAKAGQDVFNSIEQTTKPVIAAVNGYALGGGCELAMACHFRVVTANAVFGQPEVNLGLIPGYGGTQRLVRYLGKTKAMELLMRGSNIDAQKAHTLGLVNDVVTPEELIDKCIHIIAEIHKKAPQAIAGIIAAVNAYYANSKGYEAELDEFSKCFATSDIKEGIAAFLEKRPPKFTGN